MLREIDAIVNELVQPDTPGLAVGIIQDGVPVHQQGYGLANLDWQIPVEPDTVFRLASITKQFTAVAIMLLVADGKLKLDDSLEKFLPDYPTSGHHITIYHLLTHTSGIRSYTSLETFEQTMRNDYTPAELVELFARVPFDFKPGTQYRYNNSGYLLLGVIIEKLSGMRYADFIQQRIFAPAGMHSSHYMSDVRIIPRRATGYTTMNDQAYAADFISMTQPFAAGGLGASLNDMLRWDAALRNNAIITAETLQQMQTPASLADGTPIDYGFGWAFGTYAEHPMIQHAGGIQGFRTFQMRFSDDDLSVIVLCNWEAVDVMKLSANIARQLLGLPAITRRPFLLGPEALLKIAGIWHDDNGSIELKIAAGGEITLQYPESEQRLLASSRTQFYVVDDPEVTLDFSVEQDGHFTQLTIHYPFFARQLARVANAPIMT